jgi:hypothetical protein
MVNQYANGRRQASNPLVGLPAKFRQSLIGSSTVIHQVLNGFLKVGQGNIMVF